MINNVHAPRSSSSRLRLYSSSRLRLVVPVLALVMTLASLACQSGTSGGGDSRGIIIVNAPAAGEVRRVLAREGMTVSEGQPIVEIAVQEEGPAAPTPSPGESAEARAVRNFKAADAEIEAARAEAVQHEAEVQRLTPLVANGEASQAQLEGERALYERAQQRLQKAQDTKRSAETGLLASRQPGQQQNPGSTAPPAPRERIVTANASSAGTVSVISARPGQKVTSGQPLATLRADQR